MEKIGLVLEGGASRGVFTAGVLDYWMEQGITFPYVVGVSAGACNAADLVSKQIGRTRNTMIHKDKKYEYMGLRTFFKTRQLMDMDLIFRTFPEEYFPFDYDTYFASETEVEYGCTDCHTGRPVFLSEKQDKGRLMDILRASCAMPGAVRPVLVDGKPYVDGGLSDSIPVKHAFAMGCDKVVVLRHRTIRCWEALLSAIPFLSDCGFTMVSRSMRRDSESGYSINLPPLRCLCLR